MRRREFIAGLGSTAAWPVVARAQQAAMPVIGYLSSRTAESDASMLVAVRRGLADVGYGEGRNVAIEYRFGDNQYDRLPSQLTDLTQRKVGVIVLAGFLSSTRRRATSRRWRACCRASLVRPFGRDRVMKATSETGRAPKRARARSPL
jgi:putative ABC transport system substrate-binding protein